MRAAGLVEQIDDQAVADYLEFGFVPDARSIYRDVVKVPAASLIEWSDGELHTREYWSLPDVNHDCRLTFDEAVEETERIFLEAVEIRLRADVPVGSLLSGGVDSSLVCWATAKLRAEIAAYTVGTPGDPGDESSDARATAATLGLDHRLLPLSATDAPDVSELVSAYAEPFACASAIGMLGVSRAVRKSAKVLLTGDGGDDVFLGYPEHRNFLTAQRVAGALPEWQGTSGKAAEVFSLEGGLSGARRPLWISRRAGLAASRRCTMDSRFINRPASLGQDFVMRESISALSRGRHSQREIC